MSDLSINNRCPECRIVLQLGKCQRCKRQVKPKPPNSGYRGFPARTREKSDLGKLHGEAFYAEFNRVFNVPEVKISRDAMEYWERLSAVGSL